MPFLLKIFPLSRDSFKVTIEMKSKLEEFVYTVLLGPIIETVIFIVAPIKILEDKLNIFAIGLLGSFLFSLSHFYSINYIFLSFLIGIFLFGCFLFLKHKFSFTLAFIGVTLIHLSNNLYNFILDINT